MFCAWYAPAFLYQHYNALSHQRIQAATDNYPRRAASITAIGLEKTSPKILTCLQNVSSETEKTGHTSTAELGSTTSERSWAGGSWLGSNAS